MQHSDTPLVNYGAFEDRALNRLIAERLGYEAVQTARGYSLLDPDNNYVCPEPGYNYHADTVEGAWRRLCPAFSTDTNLAQDLMREMVATARKMNVHPRYIHIEIEQGWNATYDKFQWWATFSDRYIQGNGLQGPQVTADTLPRAIAELYLLYADTLDQPRSEWYLADGVNNEQL